MREYYKNPEETKKSFYKDWFLTGDLGLMDDFGILQLTSHYWALLVKMSALFIRVT